MEISASGTTLGIADDGKAASACAEAAPDERDFLREALVPFFDQPCPLNRRRCLEGGAGA